MTLREELGKRLYIHGNMLDEPIIEDNPCPAWEMAGSMKRECWRALADECIRQMEWARECGFDSCCNRSNDKRIPLEAGVTLAPEDWKP